MVILAVLARISESSRRDEVVGNNSATGTATNN